MRLTFAERDRKIIPILLGLLVPSACAFAQHLPTGTPESVGLSSDDGSAARRCSTISMTSKLQAPSPW